MKNQKNLDRASIDNKFVFADEKSSHFKVLYATYWITA